MAQANYKITITDHDYHYTTYIAWVSGSSRNQAIAKAAALVGQEKNRRRYNRQGRPADLFPDGLYEPEVRVEYAALEEYWDHREEVMVQE